jgi:hypothetical protein
LENKQIKNNNQVVKSRFERASAWTLAKVKGSFVGKFFTSYEKINKAYVSKTKKIRDKKKTRGKPLVFLLACRSLLLTREISRF